MVFRVKIAVTHGGWVMTGRGTRGLLGTSNVLFLDQNADYLGVLRLGKFIVLYPFKIKLFCMSNI